MKQYIASITLVIPAEDKDMAIDGLFDYLSECVRHEDISGFEIKEEEDNRLTLNN